MDNRPDLSCPYFFLLVGARVNSAFGQIIVINNFRNCEKVGFLTVKTGAISSSGTNSGLNFAGEIHGSSSLTGRRVTMISPFSKEKKKYC